MTCYHLCVITSEGLSSLIALFVSISVSRTWYIFHSVFLPDISSTLCSYLIYLPLCVLTWYIFHPVFLPDISSTLCSYLIYLPLCVLTWYIFHSVFLPDISSTLCSYLIYLPLCVLTWYIFHSVFLPDISSTLCSYLIYLPLCILQLQLLLSIPSLFLQRLQPLIDGAHRVSDEFSAVGRSLRHHGRRYVVHRRNLHVQCL